MQYPTAGSEATEQKIDCPDENFAMRSEVSNGPLCGARRDADQTIDDDDVILPFDADHRSESPGDSRHPAAWCKRGDHQAVIPGDHIRTQVDREGEGAPQRRHRVGEGVELE